MAIKVAGTVIYMQSAALAAGKAITGISKATTALVTCSTHGYTDGDIIKITGVAGMEQVNSRAFIVDGVSDSPTTGASAFKLKGCNSSNYTTYTSGGYAYKATMTAIGEVTSISEMGGTEPNEIDVSHLQSLSAAKLAGLSSQSSVSFDVWFDLTTAMHNELQLANEDLEDRVFHLYKANSFNLTLVAQVAAFKVSGGGVNEAYRGTVTLTPRAAGAWSLTT